MIKIICEYIIIFIAIYTVNYFIFIKNKTKYKKENIPPELVYLKKIYNINLKKINYKQFLYINAIINTFIITTIYIIIIYLLSSIITRIIFGIILLILMIIICYGILGRYYIWKQSK